MLTVDIVFARLQSRMGGLGFRVSDRQIKDVCVEDFYHKDYRIADQILDPTSPDSIWRLTGGPAVGNLSSRIEPYACAQGLAAAIGVLLEGIDETRTSVHTVSSEDEGLLFLDSGGALIASIQPLVLTSVPPELASRAEGALKGVGNREFDRFARRLTQLPGLSGVQAAEYGERRRTSIPSGGELIGDPLLKTPNSWVHAFRASMKRRCGIELTQAQGQDVLATAFGASNWHRLAAAGKTRRVAEHAHCLIADSGIELFQDLAHATAAFSMLLERSPIRYIPIIGTDGLLRAGDTGHSPDVSIVPVDVVEARATYLDVANAIALLDGSGQAEAIAAEIGAGHVMSGRVPSIMLRRPGMRSMTIRDWRFTIESFDGRDHLRAERDEARHPVQDSGWVACYKASLRLVDKGLALASNYDSQTEVVMADFGAMEQRKITEFSGIDTLPLVRRPTAVRGGVLGQ